MANLFSPMSTRIELWGTSFPQGWRWAREARFLVEKFEGQGKVMGEIFGGKI
jgi:hypothetical protein